MEYTGSRSGRPQRQQQQGQDTTQSPSQPVGPRPSAASRPVLSHDQRPSKRSSRRPRNLIIVAAVVILLCAAFAAYFFILKPASTVAAIDGGKHQAVFFTNGQVYFGKLSILNGEYLKLTNVYYLQTKEEAGEDPKLQAAENQNTSDVELIKLGNEIHGPEDEMIISRDQVLFFENLKTEGSVSKTILENQANAN